MAVARHSDNIEVQDGDQDDPDYENETTVTARRRNVETSEEGHYEHLDLQKIDNAVYGNLQTKKKLSGRRPFRVVAGCLGMLCLMLMGVVIAQAVHYHLPSNNMTNDTLVHPNNTLKSNDTLTLENSRLKILNQLKSDNRNLNREKRKLKSDNSNLNREKNQLTTNYTALLKERNQLQSEVNQLKTQPAVVAFADSCYYKTTGVKTWQEGRDGCQSQRADLVVINNREEQVFISGLNPGGYSWLGLTRTEGRWMWVDGTPLTTQYWGSGYPLNDEHSNCAFYQHYSTDPETWANVGCLATAASICETK